MELTTTRAVSEFFLRGFHLIKLPYFLYVFGKTGLSKQCRPRSDSSERGVWSGSTPFATPPAILYTFIGWKCTFYTPPHSGGGVLWFHVGRPCVRPSVRRTSVRPSVFRFRMITWVNINGFSPNLVCALIVWRYGLGLLMGEFRQLLTELSARDTPIFSFPDYNLSK